MTNDLSNRSTHFQAGLFSVMDSRLIPSLKCGSLGRKIADYRMADNHFRKPITLRGGRTLQFVRPLVMGILNVTPDSFSDGGHFVPFQAAIDHSLAMIAQGADIIDIGGESSRPGAEPVSADEELARVIPVIEALRKQTDIPISIDTCKASVAKSALEVGADIINDISALRMDPEMVELASQTGSPIILMHMLGTPHTMQQNPHYDDCVRELISFFHERVVFCTQRGVKRDRLILDPGIGFGKQLEDNLVILAGLTKFSEFGLPILVGASRKSFIRQVYPSGQPASERLGGSIAAALIAVERGAEIVRVHDVAQTVEALRIQRAIEEKS